MADLTITAANVIAQAGATKQQGVAGATITAGQAVIIDAATGRFIPAEADAEATADVRRVFLALGGASDGQPITVMRAGDVAIGATMTPGASYYLSATAGGIAPFADLGEGDTVVFLGIAKSTSIMAFRPVNSGFTLTA